MNKNIFVVTLISIIIASACKSKVEEEITVHELEAILEYIATDSLKGRYPGTLEDKVLAEYISSEMENSGAEMQAENGVQHFDVAMGIEYNTSNSISFGDHNYGYGENAEFQPLGFSLNGTLSAEITYAGRLSEIEEAGESFDKAVEGKWLMLQAEAKAGPMGHMGGSGDYIDLRTLGLRASDHKAAGVIFISETEEGINFPELSDRQRLEISIPAIMISSKLANQILQSKELGAVDDLNKKIKYKNPLSTGIEFSAVTQIDIKTASSFNSTAMITGSVDSLAQEIVVIGAHHDHLGMGGSGSSSRRPDTIAVHYGADDNASGVAGVMELAEYIGSKDPYRSFLFLTFGGEEMGLLGSKHFAENPTIDLESVQTMINLDMIGRLNDDRQVQIGGLGTSPIFRALIDTINLKYNFSLKYSEAGYGPSDHSSFYAKDIPVLFISTGAHTDYHTPADNIEKINFEGMQELLYFVADIAMELANQPAKIEFTEAGPKTAANSRGRRGGVTFGLMPDMNYDGNEGMPVTFVTEGKPAAACGMKGGDIIKAVDGKAVGNVYDYMDRLGQLKAGQSVIVKVERDKEELELLIQL